MEKSDKLKSAHVTTIRLPYHVYERFSKLRVYSEEGIEFKTIPEKFSRLMNVYEKFDSAR